MTTLTELLKASAALHRHLCPRQVLGVRMGLYAARQLDLELPQTNKRLYAFVETDGCFADGVAVATGCTLGHRTLRLMDYGKVAATFAATRTERAIRIHPSPSSRSVAVCYVLNTKSRWHTQMEAYQMMADEELLFAQEVELNLSMQTLISRPGVRVTCDACGEEIINEREVGVDGQTLCRSCAGDSYWQQKGIRLWLQTVSEETSIICANP